MTITKNLFIGSLVAAVVLLNIPTTQAVGTNLIANPSLEIPNDADPTLPDQWFIGGYGTNDRVHTYPVPGYSGLGAEIVITSYTDGDGKWYFANVAVTPGTQYYFKDYYKSDVPTEIVVRYTDGSAIETYQSISTPGPSVDWQAAVASFVPPAGTVSVTVFHFIGQVGTLTVDEFALIAQAPPTITDFVPNNSAEETIAVDDNYPLAWNQAGYGDRTANFEYVTDAHDGSKALKLTISDYVSGDAKWMYQSQAMPVGDYKFSAWYQTNTQPKVVAQFTRADNSVYFFGMPEPEPTSTDWQFYTSEFSVPSDAVNVTVFFYIQSNGWIVTDDYHVTTYSYAGFDQPIVSLTFDDGAHVNVETALPILDGFGFKTTHCYMTEPVEGVPAQIADVQAFVASGHEICSHSVTHPFLSQLTSEQRDYELSHSQSVLQTITGQEITTFSAPYGDYDTATIEQIKDYYEAHRTVNEGFNSQDNLDIYRLRVQNMFPTTSLAEFQSWVNKAMAENLWLILVYHKVVESDPLEYDTLIGDFTAQMTWLNSTGATVLPIKAALAKVTAPVITGEATDSATDSSITVMWQTDHPATSRVIYDTVSHSSLGDAPNYGYANSTIEDTNLVTNHSVVVTGLNSGTTYYFRTVSHGSPESVSSELVSSTLNNEDDDEVIDLCPNLEGNQSEVPSGYTLVDGQCIQQSSGGGSSGGSSGGGGGGSPTTDLSLTKVIVGDYPVKIDDSFTYTVTVSNAGPSTGTNVVVTDVLPASLTYQSSTASQGTYDNTTGKWTVGSLSVGTSATLQIVVKVASEGAIQNFASAISSENDPNVANNTATHIFTLGEITGASSAGGDENLIPQPAVLGATSNNLPRTGGMPISSMLYLSWLGPVLERFRRRQIKK